MMKLITVILLSSFSMVISAQFGNPKNILEELQRLKKIEAIDINNDGHQDLLVLGDLGTLGWYENLNGNHYSKMKPIKYNCIASFEILDADQDGDSDIIIVSENQDLIWLENNSSGTFNIEHIIATSLNAGTWSRFGIERCDYNFDGQYDFVYSIGNNIYIYLNNSGTFTPLVVTGYLDTYFHCVDIDSDNDIDFINEDRYFGGNIQIWKNDSNTFSDTIISTSGEYLNLNDLNNDGLNDLIYVDVVSQLVKIQLNLGNGSFSLPQLVNAGLTSTYSVITVDINGDSIPDLFNAGWDSGDHKISVNYGNGNGTFTSATNKGLFDPAYNIKQMIPFDFNQNGTIDFVYSVEADEFGLLIDLTNQQILSGYKLMEDISFFDMNHDSLLDVVLSGSETFGTDIYLIPNIYNSDFGAVEEYIEMGNVKKTKVDDINNNNIFDIFTISGVGGSNYSVNLDSNTSIESLGGSLPNNVSGEFEIIDVDFDGDKDIIYSWIGPSLDGIRFIENNNGILQPSQLIVSDNFTSFLAIDIDGDNDIDFTLQNESTGVINVLIQDSINSFSLYNADTLNTLIENAISFYDIDGDNDLDLFYSIFSSNQIYKIENYIDSFSSPTLYFTDPSGVITDFEIKDFDRDSLVDILIFGESLRWYKSNSDSTFSNSIIIFNDHNLYSSKRNIILKDFDLDGDLDVFFHDDNEILFVENYSTNTYQISVECYYDENGNISKDSTEINVPNFPIGISPSFINSYTNSLGKAFFSVIPGSYNIFSNSLPYWNVSSQNPLPVAIDSINSIVDTLSFALIPDTILTKINPELTAGFPRCNDTINYWINVKNIGTTIHNGVVNLELNDSITFISTLLPPDSIIGKNYYWHYDSLFFFGQTMILLQVKMPSFLSINDTLKSVLSVSTLDSLGIINNTFKDSLEQILTCGYDPNDKIVNPIGYGAPGYIKGNETMEYTIRFQNTGTDTVINIIIRDQLSEKLIWNTLTPVAYSHSVSTEIEPSGVVIFSFNNIMLPDSNINEIASHGFIKYSIELKDSLIPGTQFFNNAGIYFDLNPAVFTNMTTNTIECPLLTITQNDTTLSCNVSNNIQWFLNGVAIQGENNQNYATTQNGFYQVEFNNLNGCNVLSDSVSYFLNINEATPIQAIIYPNPSNGNVNLQFSEFLSDGFQLVIYDISGKEIIRVMNINSDTVTLEEDQLNAGIYILMLSDGNSQYSLGKIVIY